MGDLVFDSGPLIGLDRGEARAEALLTVATTASAIVVVPAVVLAECWRGGSRNALLGRALHACELVATTPEQARFAGELLGRARSDDTIDALVVATAIARDATVVTGDPDDVAPLAALAGVTVIPYA
ncbi:MAG TPA: PIN domain-containing protein [Solirubrobacteraceae bacterium]|nr:PIN domain-containing protein [Solirubrobacteraceae bacterium]